MTASGGQGIPQGAGASAAEERGSDSASSRSLWYPHLGLLLVYILWGVNTASMKVGGAAWDPFVFNGLRYAIVAPLLWLTVAPSFRKRGISFRMERRDFALILGLGALSAVGMEALLSYALQYSNVANGSVLGRGVMPIFTVLFALALREMRMSPRIWIGLPLAFAGAVVIVAGGGGLHFGAETVRGDALLLLRSVFGAIYLIGMSRLTSRYPLMLLVAWEMTAGAAALLPYALWKADAALIASIPPMGWASLAYTALLATLVGFTLHNWSLARIGAFRASFYGYTMPITAAASGYLLLGETITPYQIVGGAAVLAAMYLVQSRGAKANPQPKAQESS
ncbi:DMT family transporter [Paenibacillus sp.]|uniref:DMT family transporter n=1 Tax=Paenibacillus sp. TaxID=58172 RepID=UPI002D4294B5|nr:EamA family transporter [Paenibacillus sp.]HZG86218.1 EamA family transporter [Paenibacillus sp.]